MSPGFLVTLCQDRELPSVPGHLQALNPNSGRVLVSHLTANWRLPWLGWARISTMIRETVGAASSKKCQNPKLLLTPQFS